MYSDRSGYTPSNGQCLLSAWDTSGSQNHNNVYFYRQTGSASDLYKADNSSLLELIAFAEGIDSSALLKLGRSFGRFSHSGGKSCLFGFGIFRDR